MGNNNFGPLGISVLPVDLQAQDHPLYKFPASSQKSINFPGYITENQNNGIQFTNQKDSSSTDNKKLYSIDLQGLSSLSLYKLNKSADNKIWKLCSDIQSTEMEEGGEIKLGNLQLQLKHLINDKKFDSIISFSGSKNNLLSKSRVKYPKNDFVSDVIANQSSLPHCRICFQIENNYKQNPLISLCDCEGSVKFTHYQCIKKWVLTKVKQCQQLNYTFYQYSALECDLCKKSIPSHFVHEGEILSLIDRNNKQIVPPYAIFQTIHPSGSNQKKKNGIYCIKLSEGVTMSIGRGSEADIQVHNVTVSRKHTTLFYMHRKMYIRDLKSKSGTLYYTPNMLVDFNIENGGYFILKDYRIKVSIYQNSWINWQAPKTCCAASMKIHLKVVQEEDQKKSLATSRGFFDFQFVNQSL